MVNSPLEDGTRGRWIRLGALAAFVVGMLVVVKLSGVTSHLGTAEIRSTMAAAGWWGPLAYLAIFSVGELVHLPGTIFVAAAVVAYGRPLGAALAYVGAMLSLSVCFAVVRGIGGRPLGAIRWKVLTRMLAHLEEHPVRTIIAIRLLLWMTPQVNYVLALSNVRYRDYFIGSAVGLALPVIALAYLFDRLSFLLDRLAQ